MIFTTAVVLSAPSMHAQACGDKVWTQLSIPGPPAMARSDMIYDRRRNVCVLHGRNASAQTGETWELTGSAWTQRAAGAGTPLDGPFAFDVARDLSVLFEESTGTTWEWDGVQWTVRATTGPSPRTDSAMAFAETMGATYLLGGSYQADLWRWNGVNWTTVGTNAIPGRSGHALNGEGALTLYGGSAAGCVWPCGTISDLRSQYVLVPANSWLPWFGQSAPGTNVYGMRLVLDRSSGVLSTVGGGQHIIFWSNHVGLSATYISCDPWQTAVCNASPEPSPRFYPAVCFDISDNRLVLFGGGANADTWVRQVAGTPVVQIRPVDTVGLLGQPTSISATVSSATAGTFWWFRGNTQLQSGPAPSGTISLSYIISATGTQDAGDYWLRVGNSCGFVETERARVTTASPLAPTITSVEPLYSGLAGGVPLTIHGTEFNSPVQVAIGGALASNIVVVDSTTLTLTTPALSIPQSASIAVNTPGGQAISVAPIIYDHAALMVGSGTNSIGSAFELRLSSYPMKPVILLGDTAAGSVSLGGFGTAGLAFSPQLAVLLDYFGAFTHTPDSNATLDSAGQWAAEVEVPNIPILVGITLYAQAYVFSFNPLPPNTLFYLTNTLAVTIVP